MNWIEHPITLEGPRVKLVPLDSNHFPALLEIGKQQAIWEFLSIDGSTPEKLLMEFKTALLKRSSGEQYPFTVIDKQNGNIIGTTRLLNIFPEHMKLEIGWTWYHPEYWGTGYNTECKLLLLTYCFEMLRAVRVQLLTSEKNMRSRTAILKIGATYEGLMRKERKRPDGTYRDTVIFSIIDDEWPDRKKKLEQMCIPKTTPPSKSIETPDWYKE